MSFLASHVEKLVFYTFCYVFIVDAFFFLLQCQMFGLHFPFFTRRRIIPILSTVSIIPFTSPFFGLQYHFIVALNEHCFSYVSIITLYVSECVDANEVCVQKQSPVNIKC